MVYCILNISAISYQLMDNNEEKQSMGFKCFEGVK